MNCNRVRVTPVILWAKRKSVTEDKPDFFPVVSVTKHQDNRVDQAVQKGDAHDNEFHNVGHGFFRVA